MIDVIARFARLQELFLIFDGDVERNLTVSISYLLLFQRLFFLVVCCYRQSPLVGNALTHWLRDGWLHSFGIDEVALAFAVDVDYPYLIPKYTRIGAKVDGYTGSCGVGGDWTLGVVALWMRLILDACW